MSAGFPAYQIARLLEFASRKPHLASSSRFIARTVEVSHALFARAKPRGDEDLLG
jgi:hypothetical protein